MQWTPTALVSALAFGAVTIPVASYAKVYLSLEQAQKLIFGPVIFTPKPQVLSLELQAKMRQESSVSHAFQGNQIWRTPDGGWFVVDEVVGKHEMITYAIGIHPDGRIKQIEILEYKESYGFEVSEASWREQFVGKSVGSTLKLNQDIQNVSGATLSAKHLTDGVKRVMVMYQYALKNQK